MNHYKNHRVLSADERSDYSKCYSQINFTVAFSANNFNQMQGVWLGVKSITGVLKNLVENHSRAVEIRKPCKACSDTSRHWTTWPVARHSIAYCHITITCVLENWRFEVCCELSRDLPAMLCFHGFAMIRTCTYLHFTSKSPQMRCSQIVTCFGNRFHVIYSFSFLQLQANSYGGNDEILKQGLEQGVAARGPQKIFDESQPDIIEIA